MGAKTEAARATQPEVMAAVREEGGSAAAAQAEAAHMAVARTLGESLSRAEAARKDAAAAAAEHAARLTEGPRAQLGEARTEAAAAAGAATAEAATEQRHTEAAARLVQEVETALTVGDDRAARLAQEAADHAQAQAAAAAAEEEHTGDGPRALIGETPGSAAARGQTVAPQATNGLREE